MKGVLVKDEVNLLSGAQSEGPLSRRGRDREGEIDFPLL
jgi:hypothetical protein